MFASPIQGFNPRTKRGLRVKDEEHHFESLIVETQEIQFKSFTLNVNEVDVYSIERDT